jgi:inorganic triphosphatase YgiF
VGAATEATSWRARDPAVRRELPDAIHQMRVATRRMRSALQAYGRILDRARTRHLTDELKWLASVLGPARDSRFSTRASARPSPRYRTS